ncbi:NADH dehydrogenase [Gammaproteobacteria bacterium]
MTDPTRVLCLGGGYVAAYLVKALKAAIQDGRVQVMIVDRNNFHTFHGLIAEMLACKIQPGQIISPARRLFAPADFHNAEINAIDIEQQIVTTRRRLDGREYVLPYDHLVIGLGSMDDLSRYPGIAQHSFRLKSYWDCFRIRNHILKMMELASIEEDPEERRRLLSFVIAGGNYAGVEVASELEEFLHALARQHYRLLNPNELRITLVHSGEHLLPELAERYPRLARYATRFLEGLKIQIRYRCRVAAATPIEVVLNDGTRLSTRTIISCVGNAQSPLLDSLPGERDERGRVKTNELARLPGHNNLWAGGDCAAIPHPLGGTCPPLAIYAMTAGRQIGRNILRTLENRPLERYTFTGLGDACSLGHRRAVGHLKGIQLTGLPAWLVWRCFMLIYLPTWERRIRALLDWLTWPWIGRDIVSIEPDRTLGLEEALYEPGQTIIQQGEVGTALYVIQSGTVILSQEAPSGERILGTLSDGGHFGEVAVFENRQRTATVRAQTRVRLIVIRQDTAQLLSGKVCDFHRILNLPHVVQVRE